MPVLVLHVETPILHGRSTRSVGNSLIYVNTTGFDRAGHAVDTMDAASDDPALLSEDIP